VSDRLADYRRKRAPADTPEPAGEPVAEGAVAQERARFVVQEHHATRLHWDLRLEHDGVLASWAVPNGIPHDPKQNRKAVHTEDHPLEYLTFHGDIPEGSYGAGSMTIWDSGTYELHKWRAEEVMITFHGKRLTGRYVLFRAGKDPKDWMIHRMDPPVDPDRTPMPEHVPPMLATSAKALPRGDQWSFEVKWDGIRALAYSQPGRLHLESRNLNDVTAAYPELRALNRALSHHEAVLDGEIVAFDERGRPSFGRLQQRMHVRSDAQARRLARDVPVAYLVFDLLWLDGHDLTGLPLHERRTKLETLDLQGPAWRISPAHADGAALLAAAEHGGLEGVVAKRLDCPYQPGRRAASWVKVKVLRREQLVIGGWLPGEGRRRERIGALLVGVREAGGLRFAGRVGTGFGEAELDRLARLLVPEQRPTSPFTAGTGIPREAVFVEPRHCCEVEFAEWTREGLLRHPSYKGLVEDDALAVLLSERPSGDHTVAVLGRDLRLTNLPKVLYPAAGFAKADVIDYYRAIAPAALAHVRDRPLTLKRYPNGVDAPYFYEKNCPSHAPEWVQTATIGGIAYCLPNDLPTLVWLANLADLELHTSLARAADIHTPTMVVFDLDPGAPAALLECCQVGLWIRGMLAGLGLESFAKTSGSKGMQVYVPLNEESVTYDQTKGFALAVAETLERGAPELVVSRMAKKLREGRVLVDYSQNDDHKTTVAAYSLRARERPTVSTPLAWEEVEAAVEAGDASGLVFEAGEVVERVERLGDLFAPTLTLRQTLPG
jgi:bifunctional non-homologous end joining protein LigD